MPESIFVEKKTIVDTNVGGTYKIDNSDDSIKWSQASRLYISHLCVLQPGSV